MEIIEIVDSFLIPFGFKRTSIKFMFYNAKIEYKKNNDNIIFTHDEGKAFLRCFFNNEDILDILSKEQLRSLPPSFFRNKEEYETITKEYLNILSKRFL